MPKLDNEIIQAAIDGLESKKHHIDTQIAELREMLKGAHATAPAKGRRGGKRKFSPEALERMREAQKRRWAKVKGETAAAAKAAPRPKRKMSAAGRKAIAAAQKKRWANRAAQKS
jgi:hypothetical protein